jgi:hypothetical protein
VFAAVRLKKGDRVCGFFGNLGYLQVSSNFPTARLFFGYSITPHCMRNWRWLVADESFHPFGGVIIFGYRARDE